MEGASGVFGNGKDRKSRNDDALIARLYQEIGQMKVERDFLAERSGPAWNRASCETRPARQRKRVCSLPCGRHYGSTPAK